MTHALLSIVSERTLSDSFWTLVRFDDKRQGAPIYTKTGYIASRGDVALHD